MGQMNTEQRLAAEKAFVKTKVISLFYALTTHSMQSVYGLDSRDEVNRELLYKMQHRLTYYIFTEAKLESMDDARHLNSLSYEELQSVLNVLDAVKSFEEIRYWWWGTGQDSWIAYKEQQKKAKADALARHVIRVGDQGFALIEEGEMRYVQRPSTATLFEVGKDLSNITAAIKQQTGYQCKVIRIGEAQLEKN